MTKKIVERSTVERKNRGSSMANGMFWHVKAYASALFARHRRHNGGALTPA
jgi:hypothetical protein